MSNNPTPDNKDILRALADRMADVYHTHQATIGIKQNDETPSAPPSPRWIHPLPIPMRRRCGKVNEMLAAMRR